MLKNKKIIQEWGSVTAILLLTLLLSSTFQGLINLHEGIGWDGVFYWNMAAQNFHDKPYQAQAPFVYRQFIPWLAAGLADTQDEIFPVLRVMSHTANILGVYLILLLLRYFINDWRLRVFLVSLYVIHYWAPIRKTFWLPVETDYVSLLTLIALLLLAQHIRVNLRHKTPVLIGACLLAYISVWVRSSSLPYTLLLLLAISFTSGSTMHEKIWEKIRQIRQYWFLLLPCAGGALAYIYVRQNIIIDGYYGGGTVAPGNPYGYILYNFHKIYKLSMMSFIQGWYTAWGPMLVLLIWQYKLVARFLSDNWHILMFILLPVLYALFANISRFGIFAFPAYLIILGIVIQDKAEFFKQRKALFIILALAQMISSRVFWSWPVELADYAESVPASTEVVMPILFTPFTSEFNFYDTEPITNRGFYGAAVAGQHLLFSLFILIFLTGIYKRPVIKRANRPSRSTGIKKKKK